MRFEWLLIGYLFLFQIPAGKITVLPFLGFVIMQFAMFRLAKFEKIFEKAKRVLFAAIPVGLLLLLLQIYAQKTGDVLPAWYSPVYFAVRVLSELAEMGTMFYVYVGVKTMGANAEIPAFEKRAGRNMAIMFVYFVFEIIMTALSTFVPSVFAGIEVILLYPFILGLVWRILNVWMILTCYFTLAIDDETEEEKAAKAEKKRKEEIAARIEKKKKKHRK